MKKYDTIYLDWDGVIWNFKQAFCDWLSAGVPDTTKWEFYEELGMTASMFQGCLSGLPQEFWQQEKYLMPHAHKLVEWARANAENVFILTVAPEWTTAQGKQNIARKHFNLGVYTVVKAEEKTEFAKDGALLIDDKPSSVVRFANETSLSGGYIWPAEYNDGLDESWYFDVSQLDGPVNPERRRKATDCLRTFCEEYGGGAFSLGWSPAHLECIEKIEKSDRLAGTIHDTNLHDYSGKIEKPVLDYDAMDEAKKRKMTPMYSGLLAYFPDALALVARNSMVGHYQHNDPNDPMYWDRTKSADEMDAMIRHMADHSKNPRDKDGTLHMSKVAWRALAFVQKFIEEESNG